MRNGSNSGSHTLFGLARSGGLGLLMLAVAGSFGGCSYFSKDDEDEYAVIEEEPADKLYNEGLALAESGSFKEAAAKFDEIDRVHPYSDWARKALLMSAFSNFEAERYPEAIQSADRYVTLYPGSDDAAYAQYMIGESYYRQIPTVGRDQGRTERSMTAFRELVERYPTSEYATDARGKIAVAHDQLGGKEMDIGRYYLGRHDYVAAINRFRVVISDYQETRHVEEALHRLTESYYALGLVREAQTAAAVLGHNYPESSWYRDSYSLLQKGGYEPEENKRSWISKVFKRTQGGL